MTQSHPLTQDRPFQSDPMTSSHRITKHTSLFILFLPPEQIQFSKLMGELGFYFTEGIRHITDIRGYDHMLFIITLCAFYRLEQWKALLVLVTAFTIGHSLTLALSSLDIIRVNATLVEILIPVTILLTSIFNVTSTARKDKKLHTNYFLALFFGLIHGMGFSNFFRSMMMGIQDSSYLVPLLGFNLGIEVGQLFVVGVFVLLLVFFSRIMSVTHREWKIFISGGGALMSLSMIIDALVEL